MNARLLQEIHAVRPFSRRVGARRVIVASRELAILKVIAGTLRAVGEDVIETTDLSKLTRLVSMANEKKAVNLVLLDARTDEAALAAISLREAQPCLAILAIVGASGPHRAAMHAIGALTLTAPLRSNHLRSAVCASTLPVSRTAATHGFGMPQPDFETVPSAYAVG